MKRRRFERECSLSDALQAHPVGATMFESYVVAGLGGKSAAGTETTEFTVTLENIGTTGTQTHRLYLVWDGTHDLPQPYVLQQYILTEFASCGIAFAVLTHYTDWRVIAIADVGQGFGYWVRSGGQALGLEISGTLSGDVLEMRKRHREKQEQLFSSLNVGGYVVIVGLARREIIFSYHAPREVSE